MVLDFILLAIPLCVICARLYYVVFEWDNFSPDLLSIFNIRKGGLAIYGGVIGGVIAAVIFYFWRRIEVGEMMDIAAPGLIIGQAIGRWGNFTNQEAFGRAVTDTSLQWFPYAVKIDPGKPIDGVFYATGWYHATFFYESIWNLLVFAVLMLVRKKVKVRGGLFALYVTLYGFGRFWIEQLRTDSLMWNGYRVSEALSELLFFGGIAYLLYMYFSKKEFFAYSGYYDLGLTEEQIAGFKGKNALLNAKLDLKKAQWFADMIKENSKTSPQYRAVKEKAEKMSEKAKSLLDERDEDDPGVKAAQLKAEKLGAKAERIYARLKLEERLRLAKEDAEKASELVKYLKESDPDSPEVLDAQEKAGLAELLVAKIKDSMEAERIKREAKLEKAEVRIAELNKKVEEEEAQLNKKGKSKKG